MSGRKTAPAKPVKLATTGKSETAIFERPVSHRHHVPLETPTSLAALATDKPDDLRQSASDLIMFDVSHKMKRPSNGSPRIRYGYVDKVLSMPRPKTIHGGKTPIRFHYIVEWAEKRLMTPPSIAKQVGVERATVYRWFGGQLPSERHLIALAELFHIEVTDLFRHPDDNWLHRLLREKTPEQREALEDAIKAMLKIAS